jgi:DNA gyrase/topoisomerase IV subunit A
VAPATASAALDGTPAASGPAVNRCVTSGQATTGKNACTGSGGGLGGGGLGGGDGLGGGGGGGGRVYTASAQPAPAGQQLTRDRARQTVQTWLNQMFPGAKAEEGMLFYGYFTFDFERNGKVVGAVLVNEEDEIMLISDQGTLIRTPVGQVSVMGRNTKGVRLVNLDENEHLASIERILEEKELDEELPTTQEEQT